MGEGGNSSAMESNGGDAGIRNLPEAVIDFLGKHRILFEYISVPRPREYIKQFSIYCEESALSRWADDSKTLVNYTAP